MPDLGYDVDTGSEGQRVDIFDTPDDEDYPEDEENAPTPQYVIGILGFDPKAQETKSPPE